jgi:recombination protein RecA
MAVKKKLVQIDKSLTPEEQAAQLKKLLDKKYGSRASTTGTELATNNTTISTGSPQVDIALRYPMPVGIHELAGGMGAGKSTMAVHICANAQKRGWPTFYIDLERGLNNVFLQRFADLDMDKLKIKHPMTGEDATEMALDIFRTVENAVVIYDSVPSSIATEAVMAKTMSDQTMGVVAKLMGTFLPKSLGYVHDSGGRLILINQLRDNLSMYGGRPTPGGNPVEHWTTQRIFFKGHNTKANRILDNNNELVGKRVGVEVCKNRWCLPGTETEMIINFNEGIWRDLELLNIAVELGLVDKRGAGWYNYGDKKIQGEINFLESLKENKEVNSAIQSQINGMLGIKETYDLQDD